MKCANCNRDAAYEYKLNLKRSIFYCTKDLPSFLEKARKAGLLTMTDSYKSALEEGLKNIAVVPEVKPEPVVEPEVIEEPKPTTTPKKKTTKKAATKNADNS